MKKNLPKVSQVLGVKINFFLIEEVVEKISGWLRIRSSKKYLVTPNPEIIVYAQKDPFFKKILNKADLSIPDGWGVVLAAKILNLQRTQKTQSVSVLENQKIRESESQMANKPEEMERVAGTDLMIELCKLAPKYRWRIGLIGGYKETAKKTADVLRKKFPGIKIEFIDSGGKVNLQGEALQFCKASPWRKCDILFVAFGFPKQEYWIEKNKEKFPARVFIPVGGAFDYISGKVKRAPVWMQDLGLEWFYRLICQPWRIKRQLVGAKFFFLVLKEKFK